MNPNGSPFLCKRISNVYIVISEIVFKTSIFKFSLSFTKKLAGTSPYYVRRRLLAVRTGDCEPAAIVEETRLFSGAPPFRKREMASPVRYVAGPTGGRGGEYTSQKISTGKKQQP